MQLPSYYSFFLSLSPATATAPVPFFARSNKHSTMQTPAAMMGARPSGMPSVSVIFANPAATMHSAAMQLAGAGSAVMAACMVSTIPTANQASARRAKRPSPALQT